MRGCVTLRAFLPTFREVINCTPHQKRRDAEQYATMHKTFPHARHDTRSFPLRIWGYNGFFAPIDPAGLNGKAATDARSECSSMVRRRAAPQIRAQREKTAWTPTRLSPSSPRGRHSPNDRPSRPPFGLRPARFACNCAPLKPSNAMWITRRPALHSMKIPGRAACYPQGRSIRSTGEKLLLGVDIFPRCNYILPINNGD